MDTLEVVFGDLVDYDVVESCVRGADFVLHVGAVVSPLVESNLKWVWLRQTGIYNVGGGEGWRLTNWDLQVKLATAMGVADPRRWYDRNWFALKNFHGHWYTDSDRLEELVPFRQDTMEEALARLVEAMPKASQNAGKAPGWIVKYFVMKPLAFKPRGTMAAIRTKAQSAINAFFGSLKRWKQIGDWSTFEAPQPSRVPTYLGHEFVASPRLILIGGHWCPECVKDSANYGQQATHNRFLAQLETPAPIHDAAS